MLEETTQAYSLLYGSDENMYPVGALIVVRFVTLFGTVSYSVQLIDCAPRKG